ncbi:ABC transporter permease [Actinoplanes sp. RD1]|uniref:ABC transporter permease n=1 Tax=Actinoplanes sp. RD1 TaxID=3064538 RepID=UPI00274252D0|nr:ABC transporter permease [Actinoplanes sp. RD1]
MITMAWRSLRTRWSAAIGSIVAVMLGAALVAAALILQQSASAANPDGAPTPWALRDADLVVRMPDQAVAADGRAMPLTDRRRLTAGQLERIRATDGVTGVSAETPSPAYVSTGSATIGDAAKRSWAHPWSTALAEPVTLTQGTAPRAPGDVVLDRDTAAAAGATVGEQVTLVTLQGTAAYRLTGIVTWPGSQYEHAVLLTGARAAELGGDPLLALVRVSGDPAAVAKALRAALPGAEVTTDRSHALILDRRTAELSGGSSQFVLLMAASALGIAALVIASTLSVSVHQRRREIALLRTVGATPARVRRLVVGEAAFVGLFAGLLGGLLGVGLGALGIRFFAAQGMVAESVRLQVGATPLLAGTGVAVLTAILAGALPAWKASKISPADAMRSADAQPTRSSRLRVVAGFVTLGIAALFVVAGAVVANTGGYTAIDVAGVLFILSAPFLVLAAVLLGRLLLAGLLRLVTPLLGRSFGAFLATRQIRNDLSRAVGVTTPLLLMVAFACLLIFQEKGTFEAQARNYAEQLRIDLAVRGGEQLGLPPGVAGRVADVPGVAAASGMINTRLLVPRDGSSVEAVAVDPATAGELFRVPVTAGSWQDFGAGAIAVDRGVASRYGWRAGQQADVLLSDGTPQRVRVAAVFDAGAATLSVLMPRAMAQPHLLEPYDAGVLVRVGDGADPAAVAARIDALRSVDPNVEALTKDGFMAFLRAQSSGDTWIIHLFVVMIGGYAGIAAINVLVSSAMARRGQFALLRLAGAQPAYIVRAVACETAIIVAGGILLGTLVAAVPLLGYGYIFTHSLWLPFAAGPYALICGAALLVGVVGGVVPARLALRSRALDALRAG